MPEFNEDILEAAKSGDRHAISALVRTWHRPLRAFVAAMLLGSQDTDDVAQEVFLRALERLDRVTDTDALGAFLRGIARNVVRERRRKHTREQRAYLRLVENRYMTEAVNEQASILTDSETLAALRACLANLPDRSRAMLVLRYNDELTSDQIGEQFGLKGPAVRTEMRRVRVALLECIQSKQTSVSS